MKAEEIASLDIDFEVSKFEPDIKASFEYSLPWKSLSKEILLTDDEEKFAKAVHWCGVGGNVTRTVYTGSYDAFVEYLLSIKEDILKGTFKLSTTQGFPDSHGKLVAPVSWVSKIAHIINPNDYPLIYDSRVRAAIGITNTEQYDAIITKLRPLVKERSEEELYKLDSYFWAK